MSPVKMVAGEMAEEREGDMAAKAEKKRLKKLAKAKAALAEVTNTAPKVVTADDDWTLTKKEKKKRALNAANVSLDEQNNKKEKKEKKALKRKHQEEGVMAVAGEAKKRTRTRSETKLDWADEVGVSFVH